MVRPTSKIEPGSQSESQPLLKFICLQQAWNLGFMSRGYRPHPNQSISGIGLTASCGQSEMGGWVVKCFNLKRSGYTCVNSLPGSDVQPVGLLHGGPLVTLFDEYSCSSGHLRSDRFWIIVLQGLTCFCLPVDCKRKRTLAKAEL